jgi:acetyl-CoA carboxylase biotin carboxylase subunit
VRVDSALYAGYMIPPYYDSLVAKLIVHGDDRPDCLMRLRRALQEFVIEGVKTTIPLHLRLLEAPDFIAGHYDNQWLETFIKDSVGAV